ncbi:hypothetical protein N7481_000343, partial [Penicillium waksmanii]|uniref:uncharacterized protein n=1 Tax=Penicillium waksmanii TaxID=69791 RepID=UPI002547A3FC
SQFLDQFAPTSSLPHLAPPRLFSAYQARCNSSHNDPRMTPAQPFKKEVDVATEAPEQRTQPGGLDNERPVEEAAAESVNQASAGPSKRETRMHKLNKRMQEQAENYSPPESETVYVGNLFYDVEAEDLRTRMEQFGTVIQALVVYDNRGLSKGFGYVQFNTTEEARNAIENLHLRVFEGRQLVVQFSHTQLRQNDQRYEQSNTLFIGNIPYECTDRDVQAIFADIKNLVDVRFAVDRRSGAPRGFCHAEFVGIGAAVKAMEKLRVKRPYGRMLKVEFSTRKKVSFMAGENVKAQERRDWEREQQEQEAENRDIESRIDFRV